MLPSIQQLSKIVKKFFRVGGGGERFVQVSDTDFSIFPKVVRVGDRRRAAKCQVI